MIDLPRRGALGGLVAAMLAAPAMADQPLQLIEELRNGGLVVFFRHGETGSQGADRPRAVMGDCSTQRNLNDAGHAQVRQLGDDFKALKIPVAKALSSEFCRCWQHAEAMFGKGGYTVTDRLSLPVSYPGVTDADRRKSNDHLRALLAEKPADGSNTVLVSHGNNVLMLTSYHPNVQGEAVIFRPDGAGGYARLGSVMPGDWTRAARR
jgi:phosphohistidine phosphatase SixA